MPADCPAFTLRASPRARRLTLKVTPREGLVVVVPEALSPARAERLAREAVARRADWIARAEAAVAARRGEGEPDAPPAELAFRAAGEVWRVDHVARAAARTTLTVNAGRILVLSGPAERPDLLRRALEKFCRERAESSLVPLLRAEAARLGLSHGAVTVRAQRSRWGSCGPRGSINLNYRLLFLPPELARYVVLHELAHLKHRDHSERFRRALAGFLPEAEACERAMRRAGRYVPRFLAM